MRKAFARVAAVLLTALSIWALAALYFDFPVARFHGSVPTVYAAIVVALISVSRRGKLAIWAAGVAAVLIWWFSLQPSNFRNWQPDVASMPSADINRNLETIHNIRNCDYVTETKFTCKWETKTVDVSSIRGVDLFLTHWGSPYIAHAIVSYRFADGSYLATSIEARKEVGESYSAIRGFFRQYELIYLIAEERDVVRLRTNYRKDEMVSLYRTKTTPRDAQALFRQYLLWVNDVHDKPKWYNALTSNCTTGLTSYLSRTEVGGVSSWDWRTIFNGRGDEMLYQLGDLETDGLSFPDLQRRALINPMAQQNDKAPDFSDRIRLGRPGFEQR